MESLSETINLGVHLAVLAVPILLALLCYKVFRHANKKWNAADHRTLGISYWLAVRGGFLVGLVVSIIVFIYLIYLTVVR